MNEVSLSDLARGIFFTQVWKIVKQVPAGKVTTYGKVASYIPQPPGVSPQAYLAQRARWVGGAMAACPDDVPWQRVINAQGQISLRQGAEKQHLLLEEEGIEFDDRDRVNLKRYGWEGPDLDWLKENGLLAPESQQTSLF
jgi:methylated-DNA-protein-cysteine methyltransferase related protein